MFLGKVIFLLLVSTFIYFSNASLIDEMKPNWETHKFDLIAELIKSNHNENGWRSVIFIGRFPDEFYMKLSSLGCFVTRDIQGYNHEIANIHAYKPNTIIIHCSSFEEFEYAMLKAVNHVYWHPYAHFILYYDAPMNEELIARIFFILWYHMVGKSIIVHYSSQPNQKLQISHFNPYISESFKLDFNYGCWTVKGVGKPLQGYADSIACEDGCQNVTLMSKLRRKNMGTCVGYSTYSVPVDDLQLLSQVKVFEDLARDLHGFTLTAFVTDVGPFTRVAILPDGSSKFYRRDGMIWNELATLMKFKLDFSPNEGNMKSNFNFGLVAGQLVEVARRKVDLFTLPLFLMDLMVVDLDLTVPYKASGVCFLSHRAGFETVLFDLKLLIDSYSLTAQYAGCFLSLWLGFFLFSLPERGVSLDQAGKDMLNAMRNALSITLYKPPRHSKIRILLLASIWGFFIINFVTQAAIISFFTVIKRGKDMDTFDDIIEKGYGIKGVATPDVLLPETEERFKRINSMLVGTADLMDCVRELANDSQWFCLMECSTARYLERNELNSKGQQYMHVMQDRVHNRYLSMMLQKHSPMTPHINKYLSVFVEAGLIQKWEQYRYNDIKEEVPTKPLALADLKGIFQFYGIMIALCSGIFFLEVIIGFAYWAKLKYVRGWRLRRQRNLMEIRKDSG